MISIEEKCKVFDSIFKSNAYDPKLILCKPLCKPYGSRSIVHVGVDWSYVYVENENESDWFSLDFAELKSVDSSLDKTITTNENVNCFILTKEYSNISAVKSFIVDKIFKLSSQGSALRWHQERVVHPYECIEKFIIDIELKK